MKNIKCRSCFFYRNEWCEKIVDSPDPEEVRDCAYFREMTNAGGAVSGCMKHIDNAPTVDAVPVVRCRECKKKNKKKCPMTIVNFGREGKEILVQNHVPDDFYCAAGERKEGADNGS